MEEERLLILQMVADGKITAAEAAELLKALDGAREKAGPAPRGPGMEASFASIGELGHKMGELGSTMGELGGKMGDMAGNIAETIVEKVEKFATRVAEEAGKEQGWLNTLLANLNLGDMFGQQFKFEDTVSGTFAPEGDVQLDISTFNGRIDLETWDRPEFEFRLVKSIRTKEEEKAAAIADKMANFVQDGNKIRIEASSHGGEILSNCGVAVYGHLPSDRVYAAGLTTLNGRVNVEGLNASSLRVKTANGRIVATNVSGNSIELKTANGRIEFSGVTPNLVARTSNGRIVAVPGGHASGNYDLHTSNGSIRLGLVPSPDTGYDVEASTTHSKIVTELGDLEFRADERGHSRQHIHARTRGFEERPQRVHVRAKTSNGSIRIGPNVD